MTLLRINVCLRKSEVTVGRISVCNVIENLTKHARHTLSAMLLYQWRHRSVTVATMTPYWLQSDVIETPFCQRTKHNSWLFPSCYGNRSMSSSHLRFEGAWHTVYAMLFSKYEWGVPWNLYNGKIWFSHICTVITWNIGTDRSEQTVQTQIRLLLMEQSDQGLLCLLFCLHLLNTILHCKIQLFQL